MISEIIKRHVYKKEDTFNSDIIKDNFTLYQYIYRLYLLNYANQKRSKYINIPDESGNMKVVDIFKNYNSLLHKIFETDNIIVAIPNVNNIPEVTFFEVDAKDDGYAYMASYVEMGYNAEKDTVFKKNINKQGDKFFLDYKRMGKYD